MTMRRTVAGRYELVEAIGGGGMATVHRAHDRKLEREVAVKLVRPELGDNPEFSSRFEQEARRLARFAHPNIVGVYDYGVDEGTQFIVMELVPGRTLAQLIAVRGRLETHRAAEIAAEVAAALQAAHRHGVVHRDVKPGNILVTPDGRAKLADLGIAQAADDPTHTSTGQTLGSVDYFSPEQARGEPAGPQTDIYALGIVLYEMLTGRRPFGGDSPAAIALSRLTADPADPRSLVPDLPSGLVSICRRALARDADRRYRTARGVRIALERWLAGSSPRAAAGASAGRRAEDDTRPIPLAAAAPTHAVPAPPQADGDDRRRDPPPGTSRSRRGPAWALALALLLLLASVGFAGQRWLDDRTPDVPGVGAEGSAAGPTGAAAAATPEATTPSPTAVATITAPATPAPTTPAPATPAPATLPPGTAAPATPPPPQVAVAALSPPETVTRFYDLVADGTFADAYALWSDRMKATYPRQENLDDRFAQTAGVTVHRLVLASETVDRAVVQIDFTEQYDSGAWRRFDGSWELVRVDARWLLDVPHF